MSDYMSREEAINNMDIEILLNDEILKSCPFCGENVTLVSTSRTKEFIFSHKGLRNCPFYEFKMSWDVAKSLREAKDLWNRRADMRGE